MSGEGGSASNPFSLFDSLFAKREPKSDTAVGMDRHQIEKMEKLRAEEQAAGGKLRARPRQRNRPQTGQIIRGHHENPGAE